MKPAGLSQSEIDALFSSTGTEEQAPEAPAPQPALFPALEPRAAAAASPEVQAPIGLLANVEMEVAVHLGQARRSIRDILSMGPGAVVELDKLAGESVDILVNNRLVARGEIVVIGENFGVRITELIHSMGAKTK
ncbi:MAG TPA: flagellar motor switch protein FliN [Symbiobacteriaceae bacterium]|nr:flagellar motor switch protein FliN [Symbiobacteriaceae bacterium]